MNKVLAIPQELRTELAKDLKALNATRAKFAKAGLHLRIERSGTDPEWPEVGEFVGAVTLFDYVREHDA